MAGPLPNMTRIFEGQPGWRDLCDELGEAEAKAYLARRLREAADLIESPDYPKVYACNVGLSKGSLESQGFIFAVGVTLSFPWPG